MAKRRVAKQTKGRSLFAALLVGFVVIGAAVIYRRSIGISDAKKFRALYIELSQLEGDKTDLQRKILDAKSEKTIVPIAERRLGMHRARPEQVLYIPRSDGVQKP
jgi:hypothetical protein